MKTNWTGERLETFIISRDTVEYLHRYTIALEYIKNKVVLDIACGEGSFDGFPLGTGVEAALNGVVALVYDALDENLTFIEGEEIIIVENKMASIENKITNLIENQNCFI